MDTDNKSTATNTPDDIPALSKTPIRDLIKNVWRDQPFGVTVCMLFTLSALIGPELVPYDPNKINMAERLLPIGFLHPGGTDEFGRDIFSRLLSGSRVAFGVSVLSVGLSSIVGGLIGLIMGFYRGTADYVLSRVVDAFQAFPAVLLAIAVAAILGPSISTVIISIGIVGVPAVARVTRGSVLQIMAMDYVEAARAVGVRSRFIMLRTIIPNIIPPLIIQLSYLAPQAILWESGLSFLGLGMRPPDASWGTMLSSGKSYMFSMPSYAVITGVVVSIVILGVNLLGDSLRVVLDPQLRR